MLYVLIICILILLEQTLQCSISGQKEDFVAILPFILFLHLLLNQQQTLNKVDFTYYWFHQYITKVIFLFVITMICNFMQLWCWDITRNQRDGKCGNDRLKSLKVIFCLDDNINREYFVYWQAQPEQQL